MSTPAPIKHTDLALTADGRFPAGTFVAIENSEYDVSGLRARPAMLGDAAGFALRYAYEAPGLADHLAEWDGVMLAESFTAWDGRSVADPYA